MAKNGFKALKLKQISRSRQIIPLSELGIRIKDVRDAIGMTQKQLARRLKVSQPFISQIENNIDNCNLRTVQKVLAGLECELKFVIVSKTSLKKIVKGRAERRAKWLLDRTFSNMAMEKQAPSKSFYRMQLRELSIELGNNPGPELWED